MTRGFGSATTLVVLALSSVAGAQASPRALTDGGPAAILAANRQATGGDRWDGKASLKLEYDYAGQGLTGTTSTLEDLQRGLFVDAYMIGPTTGASGFDGLKAWEKEPSGTVTNQAGGDVIPLAVTEAYLDQNLWWRPDGGGAKITAGGRRTEDGKAYDVLTVTPRGGATFEAWFDAGTHLLARTVEVQSTQAITTFFSDYAATDGVQIAHKQVIEDGSGPSNRQTITLVRATFSSALPRSAYAQPKAHLSDYAIAGGAHQTTVPFRLLNNHIYAEAAVNGAKPALFIFDTGGHNILTPETAKALSVASMGSQTAAGGGESVALSGVAVAKSITVGGATLANQPISVLQFGPPGVEGVDEAGMIGYEFFARFITRFDYGRHTITFFDKRYFDPKDAGVAVPIRLYHQFPEVLGSYDGIPARFGIDTGSRMTVMLTGPFVRAHHLREKTTGGVEATTGWGIGGPSRSIVTRGGVVKLGKVTIARPLTAFSTDTGGAGAAEAFPNNIGGGLLKRFVVTFDYDHNLMYLKPVRGSVADLDSFDRSGMWINRSAAGFKVVDVAKGGPAEAAGLKAGDQIVAVDARPAAGVDLVGLREALRDDAPGTVLTLAVKRDDGVKDVRITLRNMI